MNHVTKQKPWLSAAPLVLVLAADFLYFVVWGGQIAPLPAGYRDLIPFGVVLVAAAAVMIPNAAVRTGAAVVIGIVGFFGFASIGMFYLPAAFAAALVAHGTPRQERSSGPKKGIIYTESELEEFRRRGL